MVDLRTDLNKLKLVQSHFRYIYVWIFVEDCGHTLVQQLCRPWVHGLVMNRVLLSKQKIQNSTVLNIAMSRYILNMTLSELLI